MAVIVQAGERSGSTITIISRSPFTQIGADGWAAGGAGMAGGLSSAFSNPAMQSFNTTMVYAEFGKRLRTNFFGLDYDNQFIIPAFVSLGTRVNDWNLSFGYANTYNEHISTLIQETTVNFPEGTGRYFEYERSVKTHTLFGSFGREAGEAVSFGLTIGLNYVTYDETIITSGSGSGLGVILTPGVIIRAKDNLTLGATLRYASTVNINVTYITEPYTYSAQFPVSGEFGVKWDISSQLHFLASIEPQFWSGVSSGNMNNIIDIHLGAAVDLSPVVTVSGGFFTKHEPNTNNASYLDQNFLTAGVRWRSEDNIIFSTSLLDSHLFSHNAPVNYNYSNGNYEYFNQTSITVGVGYLF